MQRQLALILTIASSTFKLTRQMAVLEGEGDGVDPEVALQASLNHLPTAEEVSEQLKEEECEDIIDWYIESLCNANDLTGALEVLGITDNDEQTMLL